MTPPAPVPNQITVFAIVWLFVNIFAFVRGYKALIGLLLFSCVLQGNILLVFRQLFIGTAPLMTGCFLILKYLVSRDLIITPTSEKTLSAYRVFFAYSFILTLLSAGILFNGIPVFTTTVLYYNSYFPLHITLRTLYLIAQLTVYFWTTLVVFRISPCFNEEDIIKTIEIISIFVVVFGFLVYFLRMSGLRPAIISNLFFSQPTSSNYYDSTNRFISSFLEPSYTSVFFAALFWFRMSQPGKYNRIVTYGLLAGLLLSLGMTGFGAFAIGGIFFLIFNRDFKALAICVAIGLISLFVLLQTGYFDTIISQLLSKQQSVTRLAWNQLAKELIAETNGIGVGIGVARANSLILNILVKTGIIGFFLYSYAILQELKVLYSHARDNSLYFGLFMYVITVFAGQSIGDPDLEFDVFWFGLFLYAILIGNIEQIISEVWRKRWRLSFQS